MIICTFTSQPVDHWCAELCIYISTYRSRISSPALRWVALPPLLSNLILMIWLNHTILSPMQSNQTKALESALVNFGSSTITLLQFVSVLTDRRVLWPSTLLCNMYILVDIYLFIICLPHSTRLVQYFKGFAALVLFHLHYVQYANRTQLMWTVKCNRAKANIWIA